jgi:two-component system sensor histidine kinase SenX3
VDWGVVAGVAGGLGAGLVAGLLLVRAGRGAPRPGGASVDPVPGLTHRRAEITDGQQDPLAGLGRKSLDSLRVGVVVLDPDDVPVLVNPAARAMGLLRAGLTSGSIAAHPLIRTLAGQVRRTGVRREVELDLPRGREGGMRDSLGVHLRAMGVGAGYIAVEAADVTESHRVARVRRDFVANVSHELKTPIGALQLLAEALLDATAPGVDAPAGGGAAAPPPGNGAGPVDHAEDVAAARRFAERIQHEAVRLGRLVNELLELTRLQGAEPLPAPEPVAVDWVVAEVVDRTRTAAAARRVEVVVEGTPGLTVYGSDRQVATAVTNLVDNAIGYSGERTRVTVSTRREADHVEIAVADEGIGIDPKEMDRIFERFYRADQARSRSTGGTGLGLAIVKHIATNHGGRVAVSSTLGGGSTFTLRLPARPPDEVLPLPPSVEIETGSAEVRPA